MNVWNEGLCGLEKNVFLSAAEPQGSCETGDL